MNYPPSSIYVWGFKKDFMDHWQEIREAVLWITEPQSYWTQCSYCRHCLATWNWFCIVPLTFWASPYNNSCFDERSYEILIVLQTRICDVVGHPGLSWTGDVDLVCLWVWMSPTSHCAAGSWGCHFQVWRGNILILFFFPLACFLSEILRCLIMT